MVAHSSASSASDEDDASDSAPDSEPEIKQQPIELPYPKENESIQDYTRRLFVVLTQRDAQAAEREKAAKKRNRGLKRRLARAGADRDKYQASVISLEREVPSLRADLVKFGDRLQEATQQLADSQEELKEERASRTKEQQKHLKERTRDREQFAKEENEG